jgi:4a-hydroxytetrahydrobiopterin dehydratase
LDSPRSGRKSQGEAGLRRDRRSWRQRPELRKPSEEQEDTLMPEERTYSEEEIGRRLETELPHWDYENGCIRRKYRTSGWKGTLMVINAVGHLAEAAWHHPDLTASYGFVIVQLMTHTAKGITDKDFELARKIEETISWQPGPDSALEGTPDDPRFKYIKYDA